MTKQFYDPKGFRAKLPPGWSPALVLAIGAVAASYGSSKRKELFGKLSAFDGGVINEGKESHVPRVTVSPGRKQGQVSVEISASEGLDTIDYIWAADADTGEIFAARRLVPKDVPKLMLLVDRGRQILPFVHCERDGVWKGPAIVADV